MRREIKTNRCHPTDFEVRVYESVKKIPRGYVTTYKFLAEHIQCCSCRAVGQALKRNPFSPLVPCHRVISSSLTIGGFRGEREGSDILDKTALLAKEGIKFKNGKLANHTKLYKFTKNLDKGGGEPAL